MENAKFIELVKKAQIGDKSALNSLINEIYNDLYYFVLKTVKDENLAADVTQETCLEIITTINKLQSPEAFSIWSKRIAYHQCTRYFRKTKEVLVDENEDGETIFDELVDESEDALPEAVLEDKEFRKTIMELINGLSSEQSNAILLYYYEKMSVGQIAKIQNTTEGTVKSRLNYARKAIKGKIEDYEKRTGTKLHGVAILPLLLRFVFGADKTAIPALSVPASVAAATGVTASGAAATASVAGASASAAGASAGATVGAASVAGAKVIGSAFAVKVVAGILAGCVALGGAGFGIAKLTEALGDKKSDFDEESETVVKTDNGESISWQGVLEADWLVGEWIGMDNETTFVINEDMTIECDGKTSKIIEKSEEFNTISVRMGKHSYQEEYFECVFETPFTCNERVYVGFDLVNLDGAYEIHLKHEDYGFRTFIRESNYNIIEITKDNYQDYIQLGGMDYECLPYSEAGEVEIRSNLVVEKYNFSFLREMSVKYNCKVSYRDITYDEETDELTISDVANRTETVVVNRGQEFSYIEDARYCEDLWIDETHIYSNDGADNVYTGEGLLVDEVIEIVDITAKIYIPKKTKTASFPKLANVTNLENMTIEFTGDYDDEHLANVGGVLKIDGSDFEMFYKDGTGEIDTMYAVREYLAEIISFVEKYPDSFEYNEATSTFKSIKEIEVTVTAIKVMPNGEEVYYERTDIYSDVIIKIEEFGEYGRVTYVRLNQSVEPSGENSERNVFSFSFSIYDYDTTVLQ